MNGGGGSDDEAGEAADIRTLMGRVAAAISEIEQVKRERSADDVRAARTQLAALHGVARLRRELERKASAA